jgi:taurine--2-oxoglutarate transaminase
VNVGNAARIGRDHLEPGLRALAERHIVIGEVRGRDVFWALELVQDQATRTPVTADYMGRLTAELPGLGLLPFIADNRIHVVPPAVVL